MSNSSVNPGVWVCSVVEISGQCYIRWLLVESWEIYRDALKEWYPSAAWEPSYHRVWFNMGHLSGLRERVKTYIETLLGAAGGWEGDYYRCNELMKADTLRSKLFEEIHAIVLDEVNADDSGESLDAPHAYKHHCKLAYAYRDNVPEYDFYALLENIQRTPLELTLESSGYMEDPWNSTYPIVWKREAIKDLLVLAQRLNIKNDVQMLMMNAMAPATSSQPTLFWYIDDCFNLRSRSTTTSLTQMDIIALYKWIGWGETNNIKEMSGGAEETTLESFYVCPLGDANDPMRPITGYDDGRAYFDFKNWAIGEDTMGKWANVGLPMPSKKLPKASWSGSLMGAIDESAPVRDAPVALLLNDSAAKSARVSVCLLKNQITGAVLSVLGKPKFLLPEVNVLYESTEYSENEANWLLRAFQSAPHTNKPVALQTSLYEMHLAALNSLDSIPKKSAADTTSPGMAAITTRSLMEHVIHHTNLVPSSVWSPSQGVLDIFMNCIKKINQDYPDLQLQSQRNIISVLLADLVPKKRFMSGQMFQMNKPTEAIVNASMRAFIQANYRQCCTT